MAAMSERFTAIAFQPMSSGLAHARRKCTSSITRSVVARRAAPGVTASTAASSPMPTVTPAAGARSESSRMRWISPRSPSRRRLTGSRPRPGRDLEGPRYPSPRRDGHAPEEVPEERLALGGQDGLGVELHAFDGEPPVPEPHDLAVLRPGRDLEIGGEALLEDDERVIARGLEAGREPGEDAAPVVRDPRRLAMHLRLGARHRAAEGLSDALMAEAHAEDGSGRAQALDQRQRDAGLGGMPGPRRDHDPVRVHGHHVLHRERVVARHAHVGAQLPEVLDEVVGEGVVVVEDEDHRPVSWAAVRSARIMPRAFEQVSSHSVLGSESATMPAPTWMEARWPWHTTVRIVMQESMFPEYEM